MRMARAPKAAPKAARGVPLFPTPPRMPVALRAPKAVGRAAMPPKGMGMPPKGMPPKGMGKKKMGGM